MAPCPHFKVNNTSTETGKDFPAITQTAKANWVFIKGLWPSVPCGTGFHITESAPVYLQVSVYVWLVLQGSPLCLHVNLLRTAHSSCWDFSSLPVSLVTHETLPLKELLHVFTVMVLVHQDTPHSACCVLGMLPTHAYDLPPSPIPLDPFVPLDQ